MENLAALLNAGKKVTILGGAGCAGAHDGLIAVAEALKAPIVHALRGKEYIDYDNPFDVGMTGLLGFSSGCYAIMDWDVLLMLGTDFPYQKFPLDKAKSRRSTSGRRTSAVERGSALGFFGSARDGHGVVGTRQRRDINHAPGLSM